MQTHAKSLNERFRTLISLIFGLAIGCSLLFGGVPLGNVSAH